ncbi:hypothetical protein V0M98_36745 (plasmid) [Pseudomonas silesiensis]|uniref:hypothetical protein n=1 Tax=Pseudomonas silesiensis TaxID=1853130 RepID=UPI0030CE3D05
MQITYEALDGKMKTVETSTHQHVIKNILEDGSVEFVPNFIIGNEDEPLAIFSKIRDVILCLPEYIDPTQAPWMLSHIDELIDLARKGAVWIVQPPQGHGSYNLFEHHCLDKDAIYTSRFYFILHFVSAHIYGGNIGKFNRGSKTLSYSKKGVLKGASNVECMYFPRDVGDYLKSSRFNLSMSWVWSNRRVAFKAQGIKTSIDEINLALSPSDGFFIGSVGGYKKTKSPSWVKAIQGSFSNTQTFSNYYELDFSIYFATYIDVLDAIGHGKIVRVNVPLEAVFYHSNDLVSAFYVTKYLPVINVREHSVQDCTKAIKDDNAKRRFA